MSKTKTELVILVAFSHNTPCGYKIGFQHSSKKFFDSESETLSNLFKMSLSPPLLVGLGLAI